MKQIYFILAGLFLSIASFAIEPITGATSLCSGSLINLTDTTPGGAWSSSNTAVARMVSSTSGYVTGVSAGTATITYSVGASYTTMVLSVYPSPSAITGTSTICTGFSATLSDATSGGAWSSSSGIVTISGTSTTAIITALSAGTDTLTYTLTGGCAATRTMMVNTTPTPISGTSNICLSASATLSDGAVGGYWYSSAPGIANIGSVSGVISGVSAGTTNITYLLTTGCNAVSSETVNPIPTGITGPANLCPGNAVSLGDGIGGGIWSSSDNTVAIIGSLSGIISGISVGTLVITYTTSCGSVATPVTVNPSPLAITGPPLVCATASITLNDATTGGTWSSHSTSVAWVGSTSGLVTGVSSGIASITYLLANGCLATKNITVNVMPNPISGPSTVCTGSSIILHDAVTGGIWANSDTGIAPIGSASGAVTGLSVGSVIITYTISGYCSAYTAINVLASPSAIVGPTNLCPGATLNLSDATTGGDWYSSSPGTATVGVFSGAVTSVAPGSVSINYTLTSGCYATVVVTVNPNPPSITGPANACTGSTINLNDTSPGGSWSASDTAIAQIGPATGIVTGITNGTATISYTLSLTGCYTIKTETVNAAPPAVTGPDHVCEYATISLTDSVSGGVWSTSGSSVETGSASGIVTGISAGTAIVTYTTYGSCMRMANITVNVVPPISGPTHDCEGSPVIYTDAMTGGTWSNPGTAGIATIDSLTGVLTGISTGTTVITYTLPATGCISAQPIIIIPAMPSITGPSTVCAGGNTITLSDTAPGGVWVSGNTSVATTDSTVSAITGVSAGTVSITYKMFSAGCATSKTLTVNPTPAAITGASRICLLNITTLHDITPGGIWSSSSFGANIGSSNGIVSGIGAGTGIISYTLGTGCLAPFPFTVNPLPVAYTVTGGGSYCEGDTGVHIYLDGSYTGLGYQLYSGSAAETSLTGTGGSLDFGLYTTTGTYSVTAIDSSTGCTSNMSSSVAVMTNPLPAAFTVSGGGSYCAGGNGDTIRLSGSNTSVQYRQSIGGLATGSFVTGTGSILTFGPDTAAGTYTIIATNTSTGCTNNMTGSATISITPTVTPYISISATPGDTVCTGAPVTFNTITTHGGTGPVYNWSVNGSVVGSVTDSFSYTPTDGDIVTVRLTSNSLCATPADTAISVAMTVNAYPPAISGPSSICTGAIASLSDSTTGGTWVSSDPSKAAIATIGFITGGVIGVSPGTAIITYIPVTNCIITTTVVINPLPVITASSNPEVCGGKFMLTAAGGITYSWSPSSGLSCDSCAATEILPTANATFMVTGTDSAGCSNTATVSITGNRITGYVTFGAITPDTVSTMVWLTQFNTADSSVISLDSTLTCTDGGLPYYEFDGKPNGNYFVRGKLLYGNSGGNSGYVPTYGISNPHWNAATAVLHTGGFDTLHINMIYGTVPAGQGSIGGKIYSDTGTSFQTPVPGMPVFLTDTANNVLTYTYTNATGDYSFSNLAPGNYSVYPEDYVYYTTPSANIDLNSTANNITGMNFEQYIESKIIVPVQTNGIKAITPDESLTLYPNPTSGSVNIEWNGQTAGKADITVTDILGREVYKGNINITASQGLARIDLSNLKDGIYQVTILSDKIHYCGKLQIQR